MSQDQQQKSIHRALQTKDAKICLTYKTKFQPRNGNANLDNLKKFQGFLSRLKKKGVLDHRFSKCSVRSPRGSARDASGLRELFVYLLKYWLG